MDDVRPLVLALLPEALEPAARRETLVTGCPRAGLGLVQQRRRAVELPLNEERFRQLQLRLGHLRVSRWQQQDCAGDKRDYRRGIAAIVGAPGARQEMGSRPFREVRGGSVSRPELDSVAVGLLEVVAD